MGLVAGVITAALTLVGGTSVALADGDPASDVLSSYTLFNPSDTAVPVAEAARLEALLQASARAGFPIRVALINSATDLGTVTQFWSQRPGVRATNYAGYLRAELKDLYPGQVLVVMPGGFGLAGPSGGPDKVRSSESISVSAPAGGPGLAAAALNLVPQLAKADGHPLSAADIHVAPIRDVQSGKSWTVWAALGAGLLLLAGVWRWSLRARPLRAAHDHDAEAARA